MQKTNFKFEAIVHDDLSTDGSAAIIHEYAEKYPDIIKPIFETENQYSKHDGSLDRIMYGACKGKYIALCEGDDYWTDPHKLQKQVDFLDSNPQSSLCFHSHIELFPDGFVKSINRYSKDVHNCPKRDMILGGGGFMATNSLFFKASVYENYPQWAFNAPVGDLPLMLILLSIGEVGYINETMSVYRRYADGSWSSSVSSDFTRRKKLYYVLVRMWHDFDEWSDYKHHSSIKYVLKSLNKDFIKRCIKQAIKVIIRKGS